ncbi:MAG: DNA cytosine methyltransferase [Nitrososphaerales archaeon]
MNDRIRVASLFSGAGGGDLGLVGGFTFLRRRYNKTRFEIVFANDLNRYCIETYNKNFDAVAFHGDICGLSSEDVPDHDLLVGGFPCQPFSITVAGVIGQRRGIQDGRGRLFLEMARIIRDKRPRSFIAENVKGIISSNQGRDFRVILRAFSNIGYNVTWKVLNAADFGVPQRRERVFIVGTREDVGRAFLFPEPTHNEKGTNGLKKWVPLSRVLDYSVGDDKKYKFSERAVLGLIRSNKAFNKGRTQKLDQPCATVSAHLAKVSLNGTDPVIQTPKGGFRRLTTGEAAKIQSFPTSFKFAGSDVVRYRQIGNAIPPVLLWHIGKSIEAQIFSQSAGPYKTLIQSALLSS